MYLRDSLLYVQQHQIRYYRVAAELLPTADLSAAWEQLADCAPELAVLAELATGMRLTCHLAHHIALGSSARAQVAASLAQIELHAALLEALGQPAEGSLVVHMGAAADDRPALARFASHYRQLSARARARLVVEHDDRGWSLGALLGLHERCGVPVVFDYLHWRLHNPERLGLGLALGLALATWPPGVRPEVHLSTARSEAHLLPAQADKPARVLPPRPGQHADYIALSDALALLAAARGLPPFDIMLEAKASDLALLRLQAELARAGSLHAR